MQLHELKSPQRARKRKKIVGRGRGSGWGKTSGSGHKGQKARAGSGVLLSSEGGQMPLVRRLPKVGFRNQNSKIYQWVNLEKLSQLKAGTVVDVNFLKSQGLIRSSRKPVKILGQGEIKNSLTVQVDSFSKTAEEKILKAGGKVESVKTSPKAKKAN